MRSALLLLGPTGAGKTPLGDCLERRGLHGSSVLHVDFGRHLRAIASGGAVAPGLLASDVAYIQTVLRNGALLDDAHFYLAETVLRHAIGSKPGAADALVVLNGLPRHVGQAVAIAAMLDVETVIYLDCPAAVVYERIRRNSGGDRARRVDDTLEAITERLAVFEARTRPLVKHYRDHGVPVVHVPVSVSMTGEQGQQTVARLVPSGVLCAGSGLPPSTDILT